MSTRVAHGRDRLSRRGVLHPQVKADALAAFLAHREVRPEHHEIGAEVAADARQRVLREAVGVSQLEIQFHAHDLFARDRSQLLAGSQLRRQHVREGGRQPRRIGSL